MVVLGPLVTRRAVPAVTRAPAIVPSALPEAGGALPAPRPFAYAPVASRPADAAADSSNGHARPNRLDGRPAFTFVARNLSAVHGPAERATTMAMIFSKRTVEPPRCCRRVPGTNGKWQPIGSCISLLLFPRRPEYRRLELSGRRARRI